MRAEERQDEQPNDWSSIAHAASLCCGSPMRSISRGAVRKFTPTTREIACNKCAGNVH